MNNKKKNKDKQWNKQKKNRKKEKRIFKFTIIKVLDQKDAIEKLNDKILVIEFENKTYKQKLSIIEIDFIKLQSRRQTQDQQSEQDKQILKKQLQEKKKQLLQLQTENKKQHDQDVSQIDELQVELNNISNQFQLREIEIQQSYKILSELQDFFLKQIDVIMKINQLRFIK